MTEGVSDVDSLHPLLHDAVSLHHAGRLTEAAKIYELILADIPDQFDALHMMGVIALQQGRFEEAQHRIAKALELQPENAGALGNLTAAFLGNRKLEKALECGRRALIVQPDSNDLQINVGTALHELGHYEQAIPIFRSALESSSNSALVCNLLGSCLLKTGDAGGAEKAFAIAAEASPTDADSWANLSVALNALGEHQRALDFASKALSLRSDSANALSAHAASLLELGKVEEAIASYREAAKHSPSIQTLCAFANALFTSGLTDEAEDVLRRAIEVDGSSASARWIHALAAVRPVCDSVEETEEVRRKLSDALVNLNDWFNNTDVPTAHTAVGNAQPFYLAYHALSNVELLKRYGNLCVTWMKTLPAARQLSAPLGRRTGKFRIGIASAHIRDHSVWIAISKGWATRIDRKKFEIYLFSLNPQSDKITGEAKREADFFDGQVKGVADWVDSIQKANLDALIYPGIGMDCLTYQLASLRLAPLQAASWGHPETTGLATIDYYLSGDAFEGSDADQNYSEKLVRLPNLGCYVEPLVPKMKDPDFTALKLPRGVPLLLCPGTPFKYTPHSDRIWVQIAKGLSNRGGRLVFFASSRGAMYILLMARFRRAFKAAGLAFEEHVCVLPVLPRQQFYGLMQKSTLMLDTIGFSGFNTALQGLECGLPVLAYEGKFMRGRLASGIMRTMGMPDLVATSPEDFIRKAVDLALDDRKLKKLRSEIPKRRKALFCDDSPVRALEEFLEREISKQRATDASVRA